MLHVEKAAVWQRFNEDKFWRKHNCLLTHGKGQPSRGVRRLLYRLNQELNLPIYCLLDCDPWGHYIYCVIKQGSISLAFESQRLAIPDAKFIGNVIYDNSSLGNLPLAAAYSLLPILIMIGYLLAARRMGAFESL